MSNYSNGLFGAASVKSAHDVESTQWTKYHSQQYHGFTAEDGNSLFDKLCGKHVEMVGFNNELNGADRIVNGIKIQTKYCRSAYHSVNNAFGSDGMYRYPAMKLEVPKGQGEDAIRYFEERIRQGRVPGVSDPSQARSMVIEGHYTYDQAIRLGKAGNIDSILFDAANQAVTCGCAAGLSFVVTYTMARIGGASPKDAAKAAIAQAVKSGATVMVAGVAVQQFLRLQVGRNVAAAATHATKRGVDAVCKTALGTATVEKVATGMLGKSVGGAAARKTCVQLARSNVFTATAILAATTVPDVVRACKGKKTWKQVGKDSCSNAVGLGTGSVGTWAGVAIGTAICPGIGSAIGGFIGGILAGTAGSIATRSAIDYVITSHSGK